MTTNTPLTGNRWYKTVFTHASVQGEGKAFVNGHVFASYCWICEREFNSDLSRHDHHVIPTAFGGKDGPQVSVCSPHHELLHKVSDKLVSEQSFQSLTVGISGLPMIRMLYLASRAAAAEIMTKWEPTRAVNVNFKLSNAEIEDLADAARHLNINRSTLIREAVKYYIARRKAARL